MEGGVIRVISVFVLLNIWGIIVRYLFVVFYVRIRVYVCVWVFVIVCMGILVFFVREVSMKCNFFFGL